MLFQVIAIHCICLLLLSDANLQGLLLFFQLITLASEQLFLILGDRD